jgi:predicted Zn-dependent protease with MMP-like domain
MTTLLFQGESRSGIVRTPAIDAAADDLKIRDFTAVVFGVRGPALNPRTRERFDRELDWVLERMPPLVHELIERVALHVEDYPSPEVMAQTGVTYRDDLCGLFSGIPVTERSIDHSGTLPEVVTIYREGILAAARDRSGRIRLGRLRREIRITLLHELAHFHGLTEEELEELGYG